MKRLRWRLRWLNKSAVVKSKRRVKGMELRILILEMTDEPKEAGLVNSWRCTYRRRAVAIVFRLRSMGRRRRWRQAKELVGLRSGREVRVVHSAPL